VNGFPAGDRQHWRAIIDAVDQPIIVAGTDGVIAEFNAAAEQLTGYPAGEVVERLPLAALYDSRQIAARARALSLERGERLEPGFDTLLAAGTQNGSDRQWTLVRKDGRRVAVSVAWRALRGALGTLEGCVVLPRELTAPDPTRKADGAPPSAAQRERLDVRSVPAPCFTPSDALRRLNGDNGLLIELAGLFQRERGALGADIRRAVEAGDARAVERGAHRLRSALLNLAAGPAAKAALSLEEGGRRGCVPPPEQVAALLAELDRLSEALASFCGGSP